MVQIRMSDEERDRIARAAELDGRSMSAWARMVLLDHAVGPGEGLPPDRVERRTVGEGNSLASEGSTVLQQPRAASAGEPSAATESPRPGSCPMDVPVGVKCKVCGKVHRPRVRVA